MALAHLTPAIGTGSPNGCQDKRVGNVDQRGYARPASSCDIGAYDSKGTAPVGVNTTTDQATGKCLAVTNECSLRDAIANASSGDTITFVPGLTGTIYLKLGQLVIPRTLTINGPNSWPGITIDGGGVTRVFYIYGGVFPQPGQPVIPILLNNLTIQNGFAPPDSASSSDNYKGGGIFTFTPHLTVNNSTFLNNVALNSGGAIYCACGGSLT